MKFISRLTRNAAIAWSLTVLFVMQWWILMVVLGIISAKTLGLRLPQILLIAGFGLAAYFIVVLFGQIKNDAPLPGEDKWSALGSAAFAGAAAAAGVAAWSGSFQDDSDDDWNGQINPATGLMMMGMFDTAGNAFGTGSDMFSETDSSSDEHMSFNSANGLPMIDDFTDIHGNSFGTTNMDDMHHHSAMDDMSHHCGMDDMHHHSMFDD